MKTKEPYLFNILEAIEKIVFYVKDTKDAEDLIDDPKTFDACLMQLQHIGETANKLEKNFPEFDEIPIKQLVDFRNLISHEYASLAAEDVRKVIQKDLAGIKQTIQKQLKLK